MMKREFRRNRKTRRIDRNLKRSILLTLSHMKKCFLLLLLFSIGLAFIYTPFQKSLVVEDGKTKKLIAFIPMYKDDYTFGIRYTHSIHLSDVEETYRILADGTIRQFELMYEDTSVGMPSNAEDGETFVMENGKFFIKNMRRDFQSIYIRTAQVVGSHKLMIGKNDVDFTAFVVPGSLVQVKIRRLSLWQMWKGVKIDGAST